MQTTLLKWETDEDTVVPGHHSPDIHAFKWESDEDTVVPGHHSPDFGTFNWN